MTDRAWRTIDSAPKDGTDVLVLLNFDDVPIVHIAWYRGREEWEQSGQYCGGWATFEDWEGWWSYTRNSLTQERLREPSHWQPVPKLPKPEDAAAAMTEGKPT